MCERDADDLGWFSSCVESFSEGDEVWLVAATDAGDDEEEIADGGAASSDGAFALMLSAVLSQRREAGELGDGLMGEGSYLWHVGHDAGDGAVGDALDGAEGEVELAPERVGVDVLGDGFCEVGDLAFEQVEDLGEGGLDAGIGDEPLLVLLRGAELGELAQAGDERAQLLLPRLAEDVRLRALDLGEPGDHGGVDAIRLFEPAHALGELTNGAGVEDGDRQTALPEKSKSLSFVAAGSLHGDQIDPVGVAEGGQLGDAFRGVGEALRYAGAPDRGVQPG